MSHATYLRAIESLGVAFVFTILSYLIGTGTTDTTNVSALELFAVITSFSCTYLCVVQSRINYPIGAVSTAAYALLFYQAGLFSSAALNLYLVPALIYGWFRWRPDSITRPVTRLKFDRWLLGYGAVAVAAYLFVLGIGTYFGATTPALDTSILVLTIVAQFMLDNKKLENWLVWVVINVVSIYVYWNAGLTLVAVQYAFFLLNTVWGFYSWYGTYKRDLANGVPIQT